MFFEQECHKLFLRNLAIPVGVNLLEYFGDLLGSLFGVVEEGLYLLGSDVAAVVSIKIAECIF